MNRKHLRYLWTILAIVLLSAAALPAKNRKGEQLLKDGQAAQAKGDWDTALDKFRQAVDQDPRDTSYVIAMRRAAFEAGQKHVENGQKLRAAGKVAEALQEFQKAILADPSSAIAIQELKHTAPLLDPNKQSSVRSDRSNLTDAERQRKEEDDRILSMQGPPVLQPTVRMLPQIKINNQPPALLFRSVAYPAGIRVSFDSQYIPPTRGFDVDLPPSTVEQAFDYLAILTHTAWKAISPNTIFVYEDNVTKRRDYDDLVTQTFYLSNVTSVQEFQEIANVVRTLGEVRRASALNAQRAIVVRDTADKVALVAKMIHDLDKPKSEVVVDVIIMESNSSRTRDLGAAIANLGTSGLPISFTPRGSIATGSTPATTDPTTGLPVAGTAGTGTSVALNNLRRISSADFSTTVPGALLTAMLTDNRTKVLNNPQVRVSDGMKVELQIGDKIPYASGSFQPGVGTVGVNPLVQTQFQFAETGVTVAIQPQVHSSSDEVTLHVDLNVSAVKQYFDIGGVKQPVIGQRKTSTEIRLHDGEVNLLGGLSQTQDSSTLTGIPGVADVPLLKYLFGSNTKETDRSDLLIFLIPHIVRSPDYAAENLKGIYVGNESIVKINYAPTPEQTSAPAPPEATQPPPAAAGATPAPNPPVAGNTTPAATPAPIAPPPGPPPAPPPAPGPAAVAVPPAPATPPGQARLSFQPGAVQVSQNAAFTLAVQVDSVTDANSLSPLQIKFDPAQVRLNDATAGELLSRTGGALATAKDIRNDTGDATLTLTLPPGTTGVTGSGTLAVLSFTSVGRGTGAITVTGASIKNSQAQPIPVALTSVAVTIQ